MQSVLEDLIRDRDVQDEYEFVQILAEGDFSCVVRGIHKKTNEAFAIKIFYSNQSDKGQVRAYMENEMVILSQISHPNIIRLYEVYRWKDIDFLVLEMMNGGQLFDRIVKKTNYTQNQAKKVIRPIIDAIRYLHQLQIVHRDLKPQNLLYDSPDQDAIIKLSDFGVSKVISNKYMTTMVGTAGYLAPEVLNGEGYSTSVDYWSIGVILYILLCGYPPFEDDDTESLFKKIKNCHYTFHGEPWDSISEDAKDLIRNLLVFDPKHRFGAAQILKHKWMRVDEKSQTKNLTKTIQKLKEGKLLKRIKRINTAVDFIGRLQFLKLQSKSGKTIE